MGTSARSVAMGASFTAEIDQGFSAYYNPASLVHLKNLRASFSNHFLMLDRQLLTINVSAPLPPSAAVGLAWYAVKNLTEDKKIRGLLNGMEKMILEES